MKPFTVTPVWPSSCIPITPEQAAELFTPEEIEKGTSHFEINYHPGSYCMQVVKSIGAIVISGKSPAERFTRESTVYTVYGRRKMTSITQPGTWSEGVISLDGKRRTCFTSDHLFELPDGKLINSAVLYLHTKQKE